MIYLPTMKRILFGLILLPALTALAVEKTAQKAHGGGSSIQAEAPPGKVYVYKTSAGVPQQMEIYFPPDHNPATASVPGMILFHGGSWRGGSLEQFRGVCAYFASRGLVCATANYSVYNGKKLPVAAMIKRVCISDAKSAIRWFKQHAKELGVDPKRIISGGGSAGGHVATIATLSSGLNAPADPQDIDTSVIAYLWFNPAYAPGDEKDPEVDALRYIKPNMPPSIVFFGDQDGYKKRMGSRA